MAHSIILLLQYVPKTSSARKQNKFYLEFGVFFWCFGFWWVALFCFVFLVCLVFLVKELQVWPE